MAKELKVAKAFQSTDRDTKEVQVINTKGGEMHKFLVQFEGRKDWIGVLKKPGNEVKAGDVLYGNIIEDGQWGKPEFKAEQRPQDGVQPSRQSAPRQAPSGDLDEKVDYLIGLVEEIAERFQVSTTQPSQSRDVAPEDIDDKPIDLSQIPY